MGCTPIPFLNHYPTPGRYPPVFFPYNEQKGWENNVSKSFLGLSTASKSVNVGGDLKGDCNNPPG